MEETNGSPKKGGIIMSLCTCGHEVRYDKETGKLYHVRRERPNVSYMLANVDIYTVKCVLCEREHRSPKCMHPVTPELEDFP